MILFQILSLTCTYLITIFNIWNFSSKLYSSRCIFPKENKYISTIIIINYKFVIIFWIFYFLIFIKTILSEKNEKSFINICLYFIDIFLYWYYSAAFLFKFNRYLLIIWSLNWLWFLYIHWNRIYIYINIWKKIINYVSCGKCYWFHNTYAFIM